MIARSREVPASGRPPKAMVPAVGASRPASRRISVVLPHPEGPTTQRNSPPARPWGALKRHSENFSGDMTNRRGRHLAVTMSSSAAYSAAPPSGLLKYQKHAEEG